MRRERSLQRRLGTSRIGRFKSMADFDWAWPEQIDRAAIDELMPLLHVSRLLGHADVSTTTKHYAGIADGTLAAAIAQIENDPPQ